MKKIKIILTILLGLGFIAGLTFFLIGYFRPKSAGLLIETTPAASVFIDGQQVGRTPYEVTRPPGEITVKLVPESQDIPLSPFETKVSLSSGIKTVIRREFGDTDETSSGEIISFEKVGRDETSLSIVSIPDNAQVGIDGQLRGFAPVKNFVSAGEHQIAVSLPGFTERNLSVKTVSGYKLIVVVKLAANGEVLPTAAPPVEEKKTLVEILSTPTGFLRVRATPSTIGVEIAQVEPGEKFPFIEEDEATGWFKIEYQEGKEGWVSNQYAKKIEELVSPSPTPTPKTP